MNLFFIVFISNIRFNTKKKIYQIKVSDSHLGLMLSLDWFQPYDGTMVSFMQQFAIYRETSGIQQRSQIMFNN